MDIRDKIVNWDGDNHMHTLFSDGMNTVDEMVIKSGKLGLANIAITDHSDAILQVFRENHGIYSAGGWWSTNSWSNTHNDVSVQFGVEGDVLNSDGDVCFSIQGQKPLFRILSAHEKAYQSDFATITDGVMRAIERHHDSIKFVAHPCKKGKFDDHYDIEALVEVANHYGVPLEINSKNIMHNRTNLTKLHTMIELADSLYLNSDAHTLYELQEARPFAINYLKEQGYL